MNRRAVLAFTLLSLIPSVCAAALETSEDLRKACEAFYALDLDGARAHDVQNATIVRDIGVVRLTKGVLIYSQALEGLTPIAVFIGEGSFSVTPVRKMDRQMLDIAASEHLGKKPGGMINTAISEAMFISYEKMQEDVKPFLSPARAATPEELDRGRKILRDRLAFVDRVNGTPELSLIAKALSAPSKSASIIADLRTADYGPLLFTWSPGSTYEVALASFKPLGSYYEVYPLIVTHKKADFDPNGRYAADPVADLHETIKVKRYRMDIEIPDLQSIFLNADVTFTPRVEGLSVVSFDLINDLTAPRWDGRQKWVDVKSIKDAAGNELPFVHRKNEVLVRLKQAPPKDQDTSLSFTLHENTLIQLSNVHWLMLNTYPWFPQYGYLGGQFEIDWTVKTVKPLTVTGSGKTVRTWEEAKLNGAQLIFDRAVQFPSLIFGRYEAARGEYASEASGQKIALAAHSWPLTIFKFTDPIICSLLNLSCPIDIEVSVPPNKPKDVVEEAKTILKFIESLYGPFPYDKMDVAMMAPGLGFGQAPPAFVQLTGEAFMSSSQLESDFFHEFYSHEIAHQWWGHKIGWIADEDVWLSESFAEYTAGLYVLNLQGRKRFTDKMRQWRKSAEIADPHGAIAWANSVSGQQAGLYRTGLIYNKGPYVVHMLRMQMGLDNFKKAMQAVFTKYGYRNISTEMLQRECELVAGYKLDFFFDQWYRGTGIPTFEYDWKSEPGPDGKHLVTISIRQRDKENFKQVLMPVYFHFKGQKEPLVRPRAITKAEDVYQIKLPQKPDKILLDEDSDLLAYIIPLGAEGGR